MRLAGNVEAVKLIKHLAPELDYCEVTIGFDALKIFGSYNEIMSYIGKNVEYDVAQDIFQNTPITRIINFYDKKTIQTVHETENIKLIPEDANTRAICNFSIEEIRPGDYENNCVAFLSKFEIGASKKAKWFDCTMVDKNAKQFILRLFTNNLEGNVDPEEVINELVGHYVKFDVNSTRYGYQTQSLELVNIPVLLPPEVEVAITQIMQVVSDDTELMDYMIQYNFINTLKGIIDSELGYHLVAIASEIYFIKAISNISNVYNIQTLIRATITSRGYLLPSKTKFSRPMLNTNKVLKSKLSSNKDLILLLDVLSEEEISSTKNVYIKIRKFTKQILDERRGLIDEEKNTYGNDVIAHVKYELSGML